MNKIIYIHLSAILKEKEQFFSSSVHDISNKFAIPRFTTFSFFLVQVKYRSKAGERIIQ